MISYSTPRNLNPSTPQKKHPNKNHHPSSAQQKKYALMMKHKDDFSSLTEFKKGDYRHFPMIPIPREVDVLGNVVFNSKTKLILNWQTDNALQQNQAIGALQTDVS